MLPRSVHLWKDRLTAAVGQPAFWALENPGGGRPLSPRRGLGKTGTGKEGKGLIVPSNTKADVADVLIKIIVVPPHRNPAPVFHG